MQFFDAIPMSLWFIYAEFNIVTIYEDFVFVVNNVGSRMIVLLIKQLDISSPTWHTSSLPAHIYGRCHNETLKICLDTSNTLPYNNIHKQCNTTKCNKLPIF